MKLNSLIIAVIGLGFIASLLFFPFNFRDQYTCLYHRLFSSASPVSEASMHHHTQMMSTDSKGATHQHGSTLIDRYVHNYAIFWWSGLLFMAGGIYLYRRLRLTEPSKV
ncbi:MAG: hypothetical protein E4H13_10980 [Calditrichales bacterium]|nr:MAG: hypothetical protein E4H13_10980 [Calditrichales bacterium]